MTTESPLSTQTPAGAPLWKLKKLTMKVLFAVPIVKSTLPGVE
jgi:hypothetical protein